jgi:Domain of unknown function (DUF4178)
VNELPTTGLATAGDRVRPTLVPRTVKCPACGAALALRSEATRFVVCRYCDAHFELGDLEARVLAKGENRPGFTYEIDHVFVWEGVRYVVAARMVFTQEDDGEVSETVEYVLWSPRRGTLYLDYDDGRWLLSRMVHVMPRCDDAFSLGEGAHVDTYDGRRWTLEEVGTSRLAYVDGSLPWVARVGDTVGYATFTASGDRGAGYEVERDHGELEFCLFRAVSRQELEAAAGKRSEKAGPAPSLDAELARVVPRDDTAVARRWLVGMVGVAACFCLLNLGIAASTSSAKVQVLDRTIPPGFKPPPPPPPPAAEKEEPDDPLEPPEPPDNTPPEPEEVPVVGGVEFPTDSFKLEKDSFLRIELSAPTLMDGWASVDVAVVQGDDDATHIMGAELTRYSDDDPDESTTLDTLDARIEDPGNYHLVLRLLGAHGTSETGGDIPVPVRIQAWAMPRMPLPFYLMAAASGLVAVVLIVVSGLTSRRRAPAGAKEKEEDGE